jgi:ribose-phosphate pyrophosphokinase
MKTDKKHIRLFSGTANQPLAGKIARYLGIPVGNVEITRFSDGEIGVRFNDNIRGADVFIVQPTIPPCDYMMELLLMIDAARRASAERITAVIPYFGYARQDRKDQPRVALSAKLVANLVSVAGTSRVLTMDLHSASIQGFFDIPFDHLYSTAIFMGYLKKHRLRNPVVVSPDVGSIKRARAYANRLKVELAVVDKKRIGPNEIGTVALMGDVADRDVILFDDIVDTAGTLCRAAELLKKSGAKTILALCTHAILSGGAVAMINESPISRLAVTDTIRIPEEKILGKIEVLSCARLFGEAIRRIHCEESISSLF